jgi:hypothetical protein
MDPILNVAFFAFHTAWIGFTSIGWIWRRTRRLHLIAVLLTAASWFGLGLRYGWGYCPCTDWHWQVRARLGYDDPASYTQLLIAVVTGVDVGAAAADALTVGVLAAAGAASLALNVGDRRRRQPS